MIARQENCQAAFMNILLHKGVYFVKYPLPPPFGKGKSCGRQIKMGTKNSERPGKRKEEIGKIPGKCSYKGNICMYIH
jgi:hypothetical protein